MLRISQTVKAKDSAFPPSTSSRGPHSAPPLSTVDDQEQETLLRNDRQRKVMDVETRAHVLSQQVVDGLPRLDVAVVQGYTTEVLGVVLEHFQHRLAIPLSAQRLDSLYHRLVHFIFSSPESFGISGRQSQELTNSE